MGSGRLAVTQHPGLPGVSAEPTPTHLCWCRLWLYLCLRLGLCLRLVCLLGWLGCLLKPSPHAAVPRPCSSRSPARRTAVHAWCRNGSRPLAVL